MTKVAVVIRTFNEGAHLRRTLEAVLTQRDVEPEVIVVDSGSTDDTLAIARSFPVQVVTLAQEKFTYGRALNRGFAATSASFVACLSAHALPLDRHWLRNLTRPFVDERVAAVVGKTLPHADCNPFDRRGLLRRCPTDACFVIDGRTPGFTNANSAIRHTVWQKLPFDESLSYSEDVLWARQLLGRGRNIYYAPDAAVYHSHNESPRELIRRFGAESRARETLDPHNPRYTLRVLCWDWLAGTAYDLWTVLKNRAGLRWALFAPRRRLAINLGRYAGARAIALPEKKSLWRRLAARQIYRAIRFVGSLAGRLAPRVVVLTRKHARPIHPKHLLDERQEHFWYADELQGGSCVLDIGCNVGAHANFAVKQGLSVIGFDVDPAALRHAHFLLRWEGAPKAMVLRADAEARFPLADRSFDRVLAFDVIEHLRQPAHLLAEIRRVMTDGGVLLLTAPNVNTSWKRRYREAGLSFFADPTHRVEYTRAGLAQTLRKAGYEVAAESPIVADTPLAPWYDLLGAFSLRLYERLADRKRKRALAEPCESTGFRLVARKVVG